MSVNYRKVFVNHSVLSTSLRHWFVLECSEAASTNSTYFAASMLLIQSNVPLRKNIFKTTTTTFRKGDQCQAEYNFICLLSTRKCNSDLSPSEVVQHNRCTIYKLTDTCFLPTGQCLLDIYEGRQIRRCNQVRWSSNHTADEVRHVRRWQMALHNCDEERKRVSIVRLILQYECLDHVRQI